jgi:hypothetical protein
MLPALTRPGRIRDIQPGFSFCFESVLNYDLIDFLKTVIG